MTLTERQRRRIVTAVFFILSGILTASWSSRIPDVQRHLELNNAAWGSVLMAMPVGMITGFILSSWVITRFGSHKVLVWSSIITALFLLSLGSAALSWQLMIALFFTGFVRTVFNLSANVNALDLQQLYTRPIISTFHGLWSLACFIAVGIGTLMIVKGVRPFVHFSIMAAACILVSILAGNIRPGKHRAPDKRPLFIKPDRYLWLLGTIAFCGMFCENTMFDWSVNYFDKVINAGKGTVTLGYTCFIITMALGRLIGDRVIYRLGHQKMLLINGSLMAAGFFIAAFFPFLLPAAMGFLLIGLGDSIIVPVIYSLAAKTKKMQAAYAVASVTLIGYGGFLSGPLVIGSISQAFGMQLAFVLAGLLALGVSGLSLRLKKYAMDD